jgi:hypothetical protein
VGYTFFGRRTSDDNQRPDDDDNNPPPGYCENRFEEVFNKRPSELDDVYDDDYLNSIGETKKYLPQIK